MMMKKYASLLFALVLALSLSVSAAADSSGVYVYDDAALLTQEEYDTLTASAMAVADQYGCGVYVVTVDDMADYIDPDAVTETGETGMAAFTEYAWDALGLAASYDSNGIMLALSMAERDFQMLAHGDTANAAFTDYGKYTMQDEFLDNFREDDWYGGFADYIAACGRYLEANANGTPIDVEPSDETEEEYEPLSFGDKLFFAALMAFRFGLPLGLIVAFNRKPLILVGTAAIMIISYVIRKLPYTVRSGSAFLYQMDPFVEEASINLGVSPMKTFFTVTARMMLPGIMSGAVLSWITCINELSSSIMLYSGKTSTIAVAIYQEVVRMSDGTAAALATILTLTTIVSLVIVFRATKGKVKIV